MTLPRPQHIESQDPRFSAFRQITLTAWLRWAVLSLVAYFVLGEFALLLSLLALGGILLFIQLKLYHKTQIENFHHYRQLEALQSLHQLIHIDYPLPPMRLWVMSPDFAVLLCGTILRKEPNLIVELGSGTSTLISGYSLRSLERGRVLSFEHMEDFAEETRTNVANHDLTRFAEVIHAPLKDDNFNGETRKWYDTNKMQNIGPIDVLVVDGPPENTQPLARYPALPALYDQLADGALILVDDFMREDEHSMVNRWLEEFDLEVVQSLANEKGAVILRKPPRP